MRKLVQGESGIGELLNKENYARLLGLELLEVGPGHSKVRLPAAEAVGNFMGVVHGGAIYSLVDEAFAAAANSHGRLAVALSVTVNYLKAADPNADLYAEASELSRSRRISTYWIEVKDPAGDLVATCQAVSYIKGDALSPG